jgi:hypothetical protein
LHEIKTKHSCGNLGTMASVVFLSMEYDKSGTMLFFILFLPSKWRDITFTRSTAYLQRLVSSSSSQCGCFVTRQALASVLSFDGKKIGKLMVLRSMRCPYHHRLGVTRQGTNMIAVNFVQLPRLCFLIFYG